MNNKNVILIMGTTASGKTDLVCRLYDEFGSEKIKIISVDSALVFREMNIGTAKPSEEMLQKYPHCLVNLISPLQNYDVANFCNDAKSCVENAIQNNQIPILVGGTTMYFYALLNGLADLPSANPEIRRQIDSDLQNFGLPYLYEKLLEVDEITAKKLSANDNQRIQRALEVFYAAKIPLSKYVENQRSFLPPENYQIHKFALYPQDLQQRTLLHQLIQQRFLQMLENGFINEVQQIQKKYIPLGLTQNHTSMRCVGYRQVWQFLESPPSTENSQENLISKGVAATRQLAKRQITWLKNNKVLSSNCQNFGISQNDSERQKLYLQLKKIISENT